MSFGDIYNQKILEYAGNLPDLPRLDAPDASARRHSRVCGSTIEIDMILKKGVVAAYGHEVATCALGQTAASIMAQHIIGATPDELRLVRTQMQAMLKSNGPPPTGRFEDLKYLEPVRDFPQRHASVMLVFEAICDALDQIEQQAKSA
ncbi:iron-sulfur cluster assembly scaffold protein [Maritalea mediterranea]|uniref:Iron-sulfur cluster assembly scaffold protein n=1 Tax=Maritalea mediterranea TaxID=2909667 RepID=A0ABS9E770_9HYPH|nr:iron-sulfur cluster assembly scaffold protein [Maritalea mediterranea]MCF4098723.1 iron-sulfur cluster assembly scaffold protein [Maritalea mediterranea]